MSKNYIKLNENDVSSQESLLSNSIKENNIYTNSNFNILSTFKLKRLFNKFNLITLFIIILILYLSGHDIFNNFYGTNEIPYKSTFKFQNISIKDENINDEKYFVSKYIRNVKKQPGYLVYERYCKIPNIDAFDPNIMQYFEKRTFQNCSTDQILTYVTFNENILKYELFFDVEVLNKSENFHSWQCCYHEIKRPIGRHSDNNYILEKCTDFKGKVELNSSIDFIIVKCENPETKKKYENGHILIPQRADVTKRFESYDNDKSKPISVYMIGIDSMSRANLIRGMPNTLEFLYGKDQQWFDMEGYNKIGDNTLPNLLALLAGYNLKSNKELCNGEDVGGIDKCPYVWKLFKKYGFTTSYAEDDYKGVIGTFNYLQEGFSEKPTDYYLRPFIMATREELRAVEKDMESVCIGPKHQSEYVLDYGMEFVKRFKNKPYFGFLWLNLFSHDGFDFSSEMDFKILEYFKELKNSGIMNESIIIFFSDHGMRWGHGNNFYEERLPFLYIWLPQWFKDKHPDIVKALTINQNRLINPFDLHMTLKNILELSGRVPASENDGKLEQAKDCKRCQSIFKEIPSNRTCSDIEIEDHWCTCNPFETIDTNENIIQEVGKFVVKYINDFIKNHNNSDIRNLCRTDIKLESIDEAYNILPLNENDIDIKTFRIVFFTKAIGHADDGKFLATVRIHLKTGIFELSGDISRLNKYANNAFCATVRDAKKFCFCNLRRTDQLHF